MHPVIDDFMCIVAPVVESADSLSLSLFLNCSQTCLNGSLYGFYVLGVCFVVSDACGSAGQWAHDTTCSLLPFVIDGGVGQVVGFDKIPDILVFPVNYEVEDVFAVSLREDRAVCSFGTFCPSDSEDNGVAFSSVDFFEDSAAPTASTGRQTFFDNQVIVVCPLSFVGGFFPDYIRIMLPDEAGYFPGVYGCHAVVCSEFNSGHFAEVITADAVFSSAECEVVSFRRFMFAEPFKSCLDDVRV